MPPLITCRVVSSPPIRISSDSMNERLVVEARAVDLRVHEDAHQVVRGRLRAPLRHDAQAVLAVLEPGLHLGGELLRILAAERAHQVVGPAQQPLVVLGLDAEQVADHDQREPRRDVAHELALAALGDVVEDLRADLAHARARSRRPGAA